MVSSVRRPADSGMHILIIKPSSLGDIICSLPVAQSIRQQLPDAVISWVVKDRFADIVRRCPTVNGEIIVFPHQAGLRGLSGLLQTIRSVGQRQFDAVLDFQGLLRSGLMTLAARAPVKIGSPYAREGSHLACTRLCGRPAADTEAHAIDKLVQFLPCLGLQPELRDPISIRGESPDALDPRLQHDNLIVMLPNSRGAHKEWPYFPELTQQILAACPDHTVVWDSHLRWEPPRLGDSRRFVNLTARTSLLQLVELLRRARLVIANDSGPLHIAAALGRPVLGLFGPTPPQRYGPYPLHLPRNNFLTAPHNDLQLLTPESVMDTVSRILSGMPHSCAA